MNCGIFTSFAKALRGAFVGLAAVAVAFSIVSEFNSDSAFNSGSAFAAESTRYGAVVIRAELAEPGSAEATTRPQVVFSPEAVAAGWKVVDGEAFTGVDARRFFLTVEAPGAKASAPRLEVVWPGVAVARVIGAQNDSFETISDESGSSRGVAFVPARASAPTGAFTEVKFGAVRLGVFHNWEVRRAGPYRDGAYPAAEIAAHLNYMAASLEVCRLLGWTEKEDAGFVDHINVYGFETHFPNGHRDFPAHFHIMLGWDGWYDTRVGHYLLDANGLIEKNNFWFQHDDIEQFYGRGETTPYEDKTGRVIFETTILPDGSGLILRPLAATENAVDPDFAADSPREYLMRAGKDGSPKSVEILSRPVGDDASAEWKLLSEATATDDAANGAFDLAITRVDGTSCNFSFKYDPDTGARVD